MDICFHCDQGPRRTELSATFSSGSFSSSTPTVPDERFILATLLLLFEYHRLQMTVPLEDSRLKLPNLQKCGEELGPEGLNSFPDKAARLISSW